MAIYSICLLILATYVFETKTSSEFVRIGTQFCNVTIAFRSPQQPRLIVPEISLRTL